jgi:hypothetical protein
MDASGHLGYCRVCEMIVQSEERQAAEEAEVKDHVVLVVTIAWAPKSKGVEALPLVMEAVDRDPADGLPPDDGIVEVMSEDGDRIDINTYGKMRQFASSMVEKLGATEMYRATCSCGWQSKLLTVRRDLAAVSAWAHRMASITVH